MNPEKNRNIEEIWDSMELPKIHDRERAEELVAGGYVSNIEGIYVELTAEQEEELAERRRKWSEYNSQLPSMDISWD